MSQTYRYYCLDGVGHLHSAEWFEAENDEQAISYVATKHANEKCEIWQAARLVGKIEPVRLQA